MSLGSEAVATIPRSGAQVKDPLRYKTVMCNKFQKLGKCPYGPRCQFAHGVNDLRNKRPHAPAGASRHATQAHLSGEGLKSSPNQLLSDQPPLPHQPLPSPAPTLFQPAPTLFHSPPAAQTHARPSAVDISLTHSEPEENMHLELNEQTGEVICRRDASQHTLSLRRQISALFNDEGLDTEQPFLDSIWGAQRQPSDSSFVKLPDFEALVKSVALPPGLRL